jgi:tetratricopeptide (TPR) repeat protein
MSLLRPAAVISPGRSVACSPLRLLLCFLFLVFMFGVMLCALSPVQAQRSTRQIAIAGEVRDPSGASIVGAAVAVLSSSGEKLVSGTTDSSGKFSLLVPPLPIYILQVSKDLFYPKALDVAPDQHEVKSLVITLEVSGSKIVDGGFSDSPDFKAAGITDWSNVGLHGSDATVKTSKSLAREAAALKSPNAGKSTEATNPPGEADKHRLLGAEKEKSGDPVGAEHEYAIATKLAPSEENYFSWGAELLLHRASAAAIEVLQKGTTAFPFSQRMRAALGAAHYENGQFAEAAEAMCHAADVNPSNSAPYFLLGRIEQGAKGSFPCSEERLRRFAFDQPQNSDANFYYGLLLLKKARQSQRKEDFQVAESAFRKAVTINPSSGEAYVQLGLLHSARGRKDDALREFQDAVRVSPQLAEAHYQLSLAYRRAGDKARADEELKRYEELHRTEEAVLEKERKEMKQFVTILQQSSPKQ